MLIRVLLAAAIALAGVAALAAPPVRSMCADPVGSSVTGIELTINSQAVAGSNCWFENVTATTRRPWCTFPQPVTENLHVVGMRYTGSNGATSTVTTKSFRTVWTGCTTMDRATSSISCTLRWIPEPPEAAATTYCGGLTVAPDVYVVTGSQAFPLKPDGTRSTTPVSAAPTRGAVCDCTGANRIVQFGATFCKVPSMSAAQTVVAGCSLKKQ